jgi:hypothetical protein
VVTSAATTSVTTPVTTARPRVPTPADDYPHHLACDLHQRALEPLHSDQFHHGDLRFLNRVSEVRSLSGAPRITSKNGP